MTPVKYLYMIKTSFWYIPSIYSISAVAFSVLSLRIEAYFMQAENFYFAIPSLLLTDINLAHTILSSISASLLTMTTITFSTILVVLTTFLSEFSPRTIQNFITDRKTQHVLGIFAGGFIYSILLLLFLRETEPGSLFLVPSFAVFFAILCLLVFVYFIHHASTWIQVSNLIHYITITTMKKIDSDFRDKEGVHADAPWEDWESEEIKHINPKKIHLRETGYIKHIDVEGMIEQAVKDNCIIRVEKKLSEYVDQSTPVLSLWSMGNHKQIGSYHRFIAVGPNKSPVDDMEFGITKLVEIALRALSPGINDPNTAINCIENLGRIMTKLGGKYLPKSYHNDRDRNLRVILEKPDFSDYLYRCFYQIRKYGFEDISVLASGLKALTIIAENNSEHVKKTVWEFTEYILEGLAEEKMLTLDKKFINERLEALARAAGHTKYFKPL
ncbi:DUF2254 domain-containing protein [Evansella clarkii]|uniref:DUF2254 domain-containing protein n=1 Tax=Evansella clarkii TaxID=79879 RepID=UPI000996272A|nr:DUF2254 domain-containing protein [Evansella clarkii]